MAAAVGRPERVRSRGGRTVRHLSRHGGVARRQARRRPSPRRHRRRHLGDGAAAACADAHHVRRHERQLVADLVARRRDDRVRLAAQRQVGPVSGALRRIGRGGAAPRIGAAARRRCRGRRTASASSTGCRIRRRLAICGCCRWRATRSPEPFLATPTDETHAQISPDGKWIAYTSNLTGRKEVWVQPFPSGLGQWQISPDASTFGGDWPRWNRNSKEIFYHSITTTSPGLYGQPDGFHGPIFSVAVKTTGGALEAASPQEVVRVMAIRLPHPGGDYQTYDVSPDGQRFLVMQRILTTDAGDRPAGAPSCRRRGSPSR